ncbi:MAG: indole-3-glycerol phosphate synthase TrpC [Taibaiella sp.]|jgi:indole-3-glycerol phosphate synthase
MNILEQIIRHKRRELQLKKRAQPIERIMNSPLMERSVNSFTDSIRDKRKPGIIAEFKRKSPSEGIINVEVDVTEVTSGYTTYGASALSVLTEGGGFGGSSYDLDLARNNKDIPLLRKDFIIDEYQVAESKAIGADVILLIAAVLKPKEVQQLARFAHSLGLQVILEIHTQEELDRFCPGIDAVGVNNRNLKAFTTNIQQSINLYPHLPAEAVKLSESGIKTPADARLLLQAGFDGLLIGSLFMRESAPHLAFADFIKSLKR